METLLLLQRLARRRTLVDEPVGLLEELDEAVAVGEDALEQDQDLALPRLDECLAAYRAALAVLGRPFGERVEILDFLPYLAVGKQSKLFSRAGIFPVL